MGKGNYYFNANVGYILLEEFDEKFVSVLCIANNKKYSFLDKDILNDFEEKLFVSKNMVDFYTKEHKFENDSLDLFFSKFSRIIEENVNKKEENEDSNNDKNLSSENVVETEVVDEKIVEEKKEKDDPFSKESIKKFVDDTVKDVKDSLKETGKFIKDLFDKL